MASAQASKNSITLKGSADIISEYLDYGINSILFQRGIYPPEDFVRKENYGLPLFMSENTSITEFLKVNLNQLKDWLVQRLVTKVSLVIVDVNIKEPLERWDFNVEYCSKENNDKIEKSDKPLKDIQREIRDVLKQIASSVAYLPLIDARCSIDLLMYTGDDVKVPQEWEETTPVDIKNAQTVGLRSFSTNIHRMKTSVVYKSDD